MSKDENAASPSSREQDLAALIQKARDNPGVSEMMEVYARAQATLTQAQPYLRAVSRSIQSVSDRTSG